MATTTPKIDDMVFIVLEVENTTICKIAAKFSSNDEIK